MPREILGVQEQCIALRRMSAQHVCCGRRRDNAEREEPLVDATIYFFGLPGPLLSSSRSSKS